MKLEKGTFTTYPAALSLAKKLEANEQVVLLWICHYTNQDGRCWPSLRRLCQDTRLSLSTVRRAIAGLVERGVLVVTHRKGESGGHTSNLYEVVLCGTEVVSDGHDPYVQGEQRTKSTQLTKSKELKDIPELQAVGEAWREITGGLLNLNRHGGDLLKIINAYGVDKVVNALKSYLGKTPTKYRSILRFIENPCIAIEKKELDFAKL